MEKIFFKFLKEYPMRSPKIQEIQHLLSQWGYPIKIDGIFGLKTQTAIKYFQFHNKIEVTGVVDNDLYSFIQQSLSTEKLLLNLFSFYKPLYDYCNFKFFPEEISLLGIRKGFNANLALNTFDDSLIVLSNGQYTNFLCSTDPGVDDCYVVSSNQQIKYEKGFHRGKEAWPCLKPKKTERIHQKLFKGGICIKTAWDWKPFNIHAGGNLSKPVGNWSEGCQVIGGAKGFNSSEYKEFLNLTYRQKQLEFIYTLVDVDIITEFLIYFLKEV